MTSRVVAALRSATASPRVGNRDQAHSAAEYEDRWRKQLAQRATLPDRLSSAEAIEHSSYGGRLLTALIDGRVQRMGAPRYFWALRARLVGLLASVLDGAVDVVDIGCGAGKNLAVLGLAGASRVLAVESTRSGCLATADLARRLGMEDVSVVQASLLDLPLTGWWRAERPVVFTNHVLEQLPNRVPAAIDAIQALSPERVVHVEPMLHPSSLVRNPLPELVDAYYRHRRDYASDIWRTLRQRSRAGQLVVEQVRHLGYSARVVNVPTVVVWRPTSREAS